MSLSMRKVCLPPQFFLALGCAAPLLPSQWPQLTTLTTSQLRSSLPIVMWPRRSAAQPPWWLPAPNGKWVGKPWSQKGEPVELLECNLLNQFLFFRGFGDARSLLLLRRNLPASQSMKRVYLSHGYSMAICVKIFIFNTESPISILSLHSSEFKCRFPLDEILALKARAQQRRVRTSPYTSVAVRLFLAKGIALFGLQFSFSAAIFSRMRTFKGTATLLLSWFSKTLSVQWRSIKCLLISLIIWKPACS